MYIWHTCGVYGGGFESLRVSVYCCVLFTHRSSPPRNNLGEPSVPRCFSWLSLVQFSIWDWDAVGDNDLVGVYYGKLRNIERKMENSKGRVATRW